MTRLINSTTTTTTALGAILALTAAGTAASPSILSNGTGHTLKSSGPRVTVDEIIADITSDPTSEEIMQDLLADWDAGVDTRWDINCDATVDGADITEALLLNGAGLLFELFPEFSSYVDVQNAFNLHWGPTSPYDYDCDGDVDVDDFLSWLAGETEKTPKQWVVVISFQTQLQYAQTVDGQGELDALIYDWVHDMGSPFDLNCDGIISGADLNEIFWMYVQGQPIVDHAGVEYQTYSDALLAAFSGWGKGSTYDYDCDGDVDVDDFNHLLSMLSPAADAAD